MNGRTSSSGHPYLQGRYEFEQVFGDLARRRRTWQVVALLALILSLILAVGFAGLARTQKVVPYVVELDRLGETRYVEEISSILPVPDSPNSYRVTWRERTDSNEGNVISAYEGYFMLRIVPPETEKEVLANPFGIYVVDYTWSRLNSLPAPEE